MRLAMSLPSSDLTGSLRGGGGDSRWEPGWRHQTDGGTDRQTCFILASSLRVCSSLRRSFLLPTRMMGTLGQKCFTSGVHFSGMFSTRRKIQDKDYRLNTYRLKEAGIPDRNSWGNPVWLFRSKQRGRWPLPDKWPTFEMVDAMFG